MHARAVSGFAGADPAAVALDDRQLRGTLRGLGHGPVAPGVGVATVSQFTADVMDHALDRLGRDSHTGHVVHHRGGTLERPGLRRGAGDLQDQGGRQLAGVKAQRLPQGEKKTGDTSGNTL